MVRSFHWRLWPATRCTADTTEKVWLLYVRVCDITQDHGCCIGWQVAAYHGMESVEDGLCNAAEDGVRSSQSWTQNCDTGMHVKLYSTLYLPLY